MVRRVFFSFHFDRDNWRANTVRNNWVTQNDQESAGYIDAVEWESLKREGNAAIKRWIRSQMNNTSVTAILIGSKTAERRWVKFEIEESLRKGNGIVGVRIHNLKNKHQQTDLKGEDPLKTIYRVEGQRHRPSNLYNTYDYIRQSGYDNFGN